MKKLFEIKNLSVSYDFYSSIFSKSKDKIFALNNVDLKIYEGEIYSIVGESGCGKSTLGKAILNLIPTSSGEVFFEGNNILNLNKKDLKYYRKNAQLIFQNPFSSLNPRMSINEILIEPLLVHDYDKKSAQQKVFEMSELVGINKNSLNSYPHEFSGGQRQRIAIARALILNPKFIVADEPVSALDVSIQAQIINLILELKEKLNLTVLFISHDLHVVKYISDRIGVMYLGEIIEEGKKDEIFENPAHPYTKALLSSIPKIEDDFKIEKLKLDGDLPSLINLQKNCKFISRCPFKISECEKSVPEKIKLSESHFVKCLNIK